MEDKLENTEATNVTSESSNNGMELKDMESKLGELQVTLTDKAAEVEELHTVALEQESELKSAQIKIEELQKSLDEANKAKEEAQRELSGIKEEALLNERLSTLKNANILRSEEAAQIKQAEKIKQMSEEEFADYVSELTDVKSQALCGTAKTDKSQEADKKDDLEKTEEVVSQVTEEIAASAEAKSRIVEILEKITKQSNPETSKNAEVQPEVKAEEAKEVASVKTEELNPAKLAKGFCDMLKYNN